MLELPNMEESCFSSQSAREYTKDIITQLKASVKNFNKMFVALIKKTQDDNVILLEGFSLFNIRIDLDKMTEKMKNTATITTFKD